MPGRQYMETWLIILQAYSFHLLHRNGTIESLGGRSYPHEYLAW